MSPTDLAALRAAIEQSEYLRGRLRRRMRRAQLAAVRCAAEGRPERARVWWRRLLDANMTRRRLTNFEIVRSASRFLAAIMANVADGYRREQMRRDELAEARAAESVPGTGRAAGKHRHKFDAAGVCQCGKAKSAAGRKPAAADVPPPVDPRQQPFKPIGTADNFADGGMGSSGMKR